MIRYYKWIKELEQITKSLNLIDSILEEMEEQGDNRDYTWYDALCQARFPLAVLEEQIKEQSK